MSAATSRESGVLPISHDDVSDANAVELDAQLGAIDSGIEEQIRTAHLFAWASRELAKWEREANRILARSANLERRGERLCGRDVELLARAEANRCVWRYRRIVALRMFATAIDTGSAIVAEIERPRKDKSEAAA